MKILTLEVYSEYQFIKALWHIFLYISLPSAMINAPKITEMCENSLSNRTVHIITSDGALLILLHKSITGGHFN